MAISTRLLLREVQWLDQLLVVWDPVTGEEWKIPEVPVYTLGFNAAVVCAAAGCDHLDCHGGPFRVAFVGSDNHGITFACTYSSEAGAWSQRIEIEEPAFVNDRPSVLVGNTVYFTCDPYNNFKIVGYNIVAQELTNGRLYLWSMKADPDGDVEWVQRRVIQHKTMLRTRGLTNPPEVVGFADGPGLIFVRTGNTVFSMELKSGHVRKVYTCRSKNYEVIVVPYMSFYTPENVGQAPQRRKSPGRDGLAAEELDVGRSCYGQTAIAMSTQCHPVTRACCCWLATKMKPSTSILLSVGLFK
ncbi:hypothetical protein ACQ4PT_039850 [Festuca glaucescens]